MKKIFLLLFFAHQLYAQDTLQVSPSLPDSLMAESDTTKKKPKKWTIISNIGLNVANVLKLNAQVGDGGSQVNLGGNLMFSPTFDNGLVNWQNNIIAQYAISKVGKQKIFTKINDMISYNTTYARRFTRKSKWGLSLGMDLNTIMTPSYSGDLIEDTTKARAGALRKFLNPLEITLRPGISYIPSPYFTVQFSGATIQFKALTDSKIANLGVWGTEPLQQQGSIYRTDFLGIGGSITAIYNRPFIKNRGLIRSEMRVFSDFLGKKNFDLDWNTSISITIFKHIVFNVLAFVRYDDGILVVTDPGKPVTKIENLIGGDLGQKVTFTSTATLSYQINF